MLVAVGAISGPLLTSTASAVAASPRAAPSIGTQLAELEASDTVTGDNCGVSVAISGTTAVVGADNYANGAGRVYVFTETATAWEQAAELEGSDTVGSSSTFLGDVFGWSVAISGTTVVVGAYNAKGAGRAYVFTKTATGWEQVAELKGSDTVTDDNFGWSVAISGTTVVVGAYSVKFAGRAYVFTKTATGWKQTAELKGSDTVTGDDDFGWSVAISGTTVVVGAPSHAGYEGRAYLFTKTVAGWKQTAELMGFDTVVANHFGDSVAISGTTAVVGAYDYAHGAGRAYVFTKTAAGWKQVAELKGSDTVGGSRAFSGDLFGRSVAISGTTVVVGAQNHADYEGRAYLFTKTVAGWRQAAELSGYLMVTKSLGNSVAISGVTAVVGAAAQDIAYVFKA
jgi:hypothetical protein